MASATSTVLVAPFLVLPVNHITTTERTPEFVWNGRFEATGYVLELKREGTEDALRVDAGFAVSETDPATSIAPVVRYRPAQPLELGVWRWRVRCTGADGAPSPWAFGRTFRIAETDEDAIDYDDGLAHPYLHVTRGRLERLKQRIADDPDTRLAYNRLLAAADLVATLEPPDEAYARSGGTQHERYPYASGMTWNRMAVLGLAYLLSGEARYAEAGRRHLLTVSAYERWVGAPFLDPDKFDPIWHAALENGMMSYGVAIGYDWLYDALSEADRATIRAALVDKGVRPLMHAWVNPETAARIPRHQNPGGNWAMVCACGGGVGALVVLAEHPEAAHWARQVRDRVRWWLQYEGGEYLVDYPWKAPRPKPAIGPDDPNFDPDGGYRETIGYMNYAMTFVNYFADSLRGISDEDLFRFYPKNLLDPLAATIYRHSAGGRDLEQSADFGDSTVTPAFHELYACLLANTGSGTAKALYDRIFGELPVTARSLLWYDADLPAASLQLPRAGKLFRGTGVVALRAGSSRRGALAAFKTRQNRGHHDIGAFSFYSSGETWITDSGNRNYDSAIYQQFLSQTKAHNLILVDGEGQLKTDGRLESFVASMGYGYARGDFGMVFPEHLEGWVREVALIAPDLFVVIDRIDGKGAHRYDWQIHPARPYVVHPDSGVEILGESDSLHVNLLAPAAWNVDVRDGYERIIPRTYLAFSPAENCEQALFFSVMAPTVGEAGPAEVRRVTAPAGIVAARILRPDAEMEIAISTNGAPIAMDLLRAQARTAVCVLERASGAPRMAALHGGTSLYARPLALGDAQERFLFSADRPVDACVEWRNGGVLYALDVPGDGPCAVSLWTGGLEAARLDGAPAGLARNELGFGALQLAPGRHELVLAARDEELDAVTHREPEPPMKRTRRDAPIYQGARVRVSSAGGDDGVTMIDRNAMTRWVTAPGTAGPHWCEIVLPEPKPMSRVSVCPTHHQDVVVLVRERAEGPWVAVGRIEAAPAEQFVEFEFERRPVDAVRVETVGTGGEEDHCGLWEVDWR